MAIDGDPDALAPPVAPSDAEPDPEPSGTTDGERTNLDVDSGEVRDTAVLERSREAAGYRVRLRAAEEQLGQRHAALGAVAANVPEWIPRRTPRPARSRWSGHNVSAVLARTQGLCFRVRGALRLSLGSVGLRIGGHPPRGRGHAGSRARPAAVSASGPARPAARW